MTTTPSPVLPATTTVGTITLLARDLPRLRDFYVSLLGLSTLNETAEQVTPKQVTLGAHGTPLLTLKAAADLPAPAKSRPGLYHTAFLMPTRADLGRWLAHVSGLGLRIGSGDHRVSEAFYLNDPEGNGIEVYADRPRDTWTWVNGQVRMDTQAAVDVADVLASAGINAAQLGQKNTPYTPPAGLTVGHVHLKVGDAAQAAQFYSQMLGLDIVAQLPGASFLSWGGYHHQLGLNEWQSQGQGQPGTPASGLHEFEILTPDLSGLRGKPGLTDHGDHLSLTDPWGNRVVVRQDLTPTQKAR